MLRENLEAEPEKKLVIIDEIQRLPELLNEIQCLKVNRKRQFILSGSSPRKIVRSGANLFGGRALRYELYPLIYKEIPDFDLIRAINRGLMPRHYLSASYNKLISAYIVNYLHDEVMSEARFLPSYQKKPKRRVILSPKFYFFDIGIANHLLRRGTILAGSESFGKAFEHFIYNEIYSHSHYSDLNYPLSYWRTASNIEVDFILGDHEVAVEVKSSETANPRHLKGLIRFSEEYNVKKLILVSNDPTPRKIDNIIILPWRVFLEQLWDGEII